MRRRSVSVARDGLSDLNLRRLILMMFLRFDDYDLFNVVNSLIVFGIEIGNVNWYFISKCF